MKNSHIFSFLLLLSSLNIQGQQLDWFVLNDAGSVITPHFLEVDPFGNSYIVGQFSGETMFHSADPNGKTHHTYTSENWNKTFITQYNHAGELQFLVKITGNGSNGRYAEPRACLLLADGRLALAVYTDLGITIEDANGEKHQVGGRQQILLLFFSTQGAYLSGTILPLEKIGQITENSTGRLYMQGLKKNYNRERNGLFYLENDQKELKQVALGDVPILDFKLLHGKIYFLTYEDKTEKYYHKTRTIGFYEVHEENIPTGLAPNFTRTFEGYSSSHVNLLETGGKVEIALRISKQSKSRFKFEAEAGKIFENNCLFMYNTAGEVTYFTDLKALSVHNFHLQGRPDGGYYATALPHQNFKFPGQDSIRIPRLPPETQEKVILSFDAYMNLQGHAFVGGASHQDPRIDLQSWEGKLIYTSKLVNFGNFMGAYKELKWRAGFYVLMLEQLK